MQKNAASQKTAKKKMQKVIASWIGEHKQMLERDDTYEEKTTGKKIKDSCLTDAVPERSVERSRRQNWLREAGGSRYFPSEIHRRTDRNTMQTLAPPLVSRYSKPGNIGRRIH